MNPSEEPAQSRQPSSPPVDPTTDPSVHGAPAGNASPGAAVENQLGATPGGSLPGAAGDGYWAAASEDPRGVPAGYAEAGEGEAHFGLAHPYGEDPEGPVGHEASRLSSWARLESPRRSAQRTVLVAAAAAVAVFLLGIPLGLLWHVLAPTVPVINLGSNGFVINDPSPEEWMAGDGWFTLLGLGFGVVVALVAWFALRRDRGPALLAGVVIGAMTAGYWSAWWVGQHLGKGAYAHWRAVAKVNATYNAPPTLHAIGPRFVAAFGAAIVLTLLAGWSNDPDLDEPGAKPGYGPNNDPDLDEHQYGPADGSYGEPQTATTAGGAATDS